MVPGRSSERRVPMQDRNRTMEVQLCKQMWSPMSSAVCASAAWQTFSMHPACISHRMLRYALRV